MELINSNGMEEFANLQSVNIEKEERDVDIEREETLEPYHEEADCCKTSLEKEKIDSNSDYLEKLLNSFSDMLQAEIHAVSQSFLSDLSENSHSIKSSIETLHSDLKRSLTHTIDNQELTIQKQHQSISKFQEDLLYKLQKPLIMEIIGIADNIRMILQEQTGNNDYESLLDAVKNLEKWVDATLSNNSVRSFRDTDLSKTELNRKRQEVIDTEETDVPEQHNTYISERPGYVWTMPYLIVNSEVQLEKVIQENSQAQMFSYVIRPEEVIKLKYRK